MSTQEITDMWDASWNEYIVKKGGEVKWNTGSESLKAGKPDVCLENTRSLGMAEIEVPCSTATEDKAP